MRVVPNRSGSEVIFTLFRAPEMSEEVFAEDAALVEHDLRQLKKVLEGDRGGGLAVGLAGGVIGGGRDRRIGLRTPIAATEGRGYRHFGQDSVFRGAARAETKS